MAAFLPEVLTTSQPTTGLLLVWVLINAFAVARIARFIVRDTITERPRHWVQNKFTGTLVEWVSCTWCVGVWLAAAATVLTCAGSTRGWWLLVASGLAVAMLAGMLNEVT